MLNDAKARSVLASGARREADCMPGIRFRDVTNPPWMSLKVTGRAAIG
jgi:hypothetical protein